MISYFYKAAAPVEGRSTAASAQPRTACSRTTADSHAEKSGRGARRRSSETPARLRPQHRTGMRQNDARRRHAPRASHRRILGPRILDRSVLGGPASMAASSCRYRGSTVIAALPCEGNLLKDFLFDFLLALHLLKPTII